MIDEIKSHEVLSKYLVDECSEGNSSVSIDSRIKKEDYVIIKVDSYYNENVRPDTPPSPDCLIIQKCVDGTYGATIVELKDISNSRGFTVDNMLGKFATCIEDFISNRFSDVLFVDYKKFKLYFVTNIDIYKRDIGLKMEVLIEHNYLYRGNRIAIQPHMPTPALKQCY